MAISAAKVSWFKLLLADLHVQMSSLSVLYCDNRSAMHIANNPVFHERTKHIDINYHYVQERSQAGKLQIVHVASNQQVAGILTKPLVLVLFKEFLSKMGVYNIYSVKVVKSCYFSC